MVSVTQPAPVSGREALRRAGPRRRARPLPHPPESMDGIPYYDEEFAMAQSHAHFQTILCLGAALNQVAKAASLRGVSDYPIWYRRPEGSRQRPLYPDYALTANPDITALTANDLLLAVEVVTTSKAAKERKDTVRMREENAAHGVPEFVLLYPEPDDARSIVWHRYDPGTQAYEVVAPPVDGRYRSTAIPGLEIEVLPRADWTEGRKVRVWLQGWEVRDSEAAEQARAAAEQARAAAEQARAAAERRAERERAEKERECAEKEREWARAERERAEKERECAEKERECAEKERERAEKERERAEKERLLALLKQAGIDPGA